MAGRYGDVDYPTLTKRAVLGCLAVFVLALAIETTVGPTLPAWERTALVDLEFLAVFGVFVSAFVFGVVMPLTE